MDFSGQKIDLYFYRKENKDKEKVQKEKQKTVHLPPLIGKTLEAKEKDIKKKDDLIKLQKLSPKKSKEVLKEKKEFKKRKSVIENHPLTQIYEDANEEASELESPLREHRVEDHDLNWNLSQEQQEMIQNTLKKYDMSEDIWKNYILTKVHGEAQLRRMGIVAPNKKVDCQMETIRFVEELE